MQTGNDNGTSNNTEENKKSTDEKKSFDERLLKYIERLTRVLIYAALFIVLVVHLIDFVVSSFD